MMYDDPSIPDWLPGATCGFQVEIWERLESGMTAREALAAYVTAADYVDGEDGLDDVAAYFAEAYARARA